MKHSHGCNCIVYWIPSGLFHSAMSLTLLLLSEHTIFTKLLVFFLDKEKLFLRVVNCEVLKYSLGTALLHWCVMLTTGAVNKKEEL